MHSTIVQLKRRDLALKTGKIILLNVIKAMLFITVISNTTSKIKDLTFKSCLCTKQ